MHAQRMPPFEHPVTVRFSDLDGLGHVNNAVFLSYLEEARCALFDQVQGGKAPSEFGFLLARAEIDFRRELLIDQEVVVEMWTEAIGNKSFTFGYHVLADGEVAAEAKTVQVYVDADGRTVPVPDAVRQVLEELRA